MCVFEILIMETQEGTSKMFVETFYSFPSVLAASTTASQLGYHFLIFHAKIKNNYSRNMQFEHLKMKKRSNEVAMVGG